MREHRIGRLILLVAAILMLAGCGGGKTVVTVTTTATNSLDSAIATLEESTKIDVDLSKAALAITKHCIGRGTLDDAYGGVNVILETTRIHPDHIYGATNADPETLEAYIRRLIREQPPTGCDPTVTGSLKVAADSLAAGR